MAPIHRLSRNTGDLPYYDPRFIHLLSQYIHHFKTNGHVELITLEEYDLYKFEGDFYGLLNKLKIPTPLHWLTLRLNDLYSPLDFRSENTLLLKPTESEVQRLYRRFRSTEKRLRF